MPPIGCARSEKGSSHFFVSDPLEPVAIAPQNAPEAVYLFFGHHIAHH